MDFNEEKDEFRKQQEEQMRQIANLNNQGIKYIDNTLKQKGKDQVITSYRNIKPNTPDYTVRLAQANKRKEDEFNMTAYQKGLTIKKPKIDKKAKIIALVASAAVIGSLYMSGVTASQQASADKYSKVDSAQTMEMTINDKNITYVNNEEGTNPRLIMEDGRGTSSYNGFSPDELKAMYESESKTNEDVTIGVRM